MTTTWMSKSTTILWAQVHKIFWSTIPWAKAWSWRADVPFIRLWKTASKTTFHIEMSCHNLKTLEKSTTQKVSFAMWRLSKSWLHENKVKFEIEEFLEAFFLNCWNFDNLRSNLKIINLKMKWFWSFFLGLWNCMKLS